MTTKDAIKLLPIDDKLKMQVLNMYDFMEPAEKLTIERMAWQMYFTMHKLEEQKNLALQFEAVTEGKAEFGKDFYAEVLKKTNEEDTKALAQTTSTVDLAAARQAMEQIINEIHAAKKTPKAKH